MVVRTESSLILLVYTALVLPLVPSALPVRVREGRSVWECQHNKENPAQPLSHQTEGRPVQLNNICFEKKLNARMDQFKLRTSK